ncbi:MAG: GntR family transcriptional regulator [Fimbriimonadales bacterium]|nr:GntR family transcriptional regulator [Fimbriimonadales bacterium]
MDANEVVRILSQRIDDGTYPAGSFLPPERELAAEMGVSRTVVQNALRRMEAECLLEREPRCRPRVAMTAGVSPQAGEMRGNDYVAACLWPTEGHCPVTLVAEGVRHILSATRHRLVMVSRRIEAPTAPELVLMEGRFLQQVAEDPHARGVLVWYLGGEVNRPYLEAIRHRGIPIVFVDRLPPCGFEADIVSTDHFGAARRATTALIDLGHRRIACVASNERVSSIRERVEGYRRALEMASIPFREELLETADSLPGETTEQAYERIVRRLLTLPNRPTAMLALNDELALQLIAAMRRLGVKVPQQCTVAGFDGVVRQVTGSRELAGCVQDWIGIGERAAELLLDRIRTGRQKPYLHLLYHAPFRRGDSLAAIYRDDKLPRGVAS